MASTWRTLAEKFDTSESQNTEILDNDVSPDANRATVRVVASFDSGGKLSAVFKKSGETNQTIDLRPDDGSGPSLTADELNTFTFTVPKGWSFNLQHDATSPSVNVLSVLEDLSGGA